MVAGEFLDYLKLPAKTVGSVAMATVASVDTPISRIILGWAERFWLINFRGRLSVRLKTAIAFSQILPNQ